MQKEKGDDRLTRRQYLKLTGVTSGGTFVGLSGCTGSRSTVRDGKYEKLSKQTNEKLLSALWQNTIGPYLQEPLWNETNRYDAGHHLMVPLHASFSLDIDDWKRQLRSHVHRFQDQGLHRYTEENLRSQNQLGMLQYLYVISRYLVLESTSGNAKEIPRRLPDHLHSIIKYLWQDFPSWHWAHEDFTGMRNRLVWKMNQNTTEYRFYRAIFDSELFVFAIAADLYIYAIERAEAEFSKESLSDILAFTKRVYEAYGQHQPDGGWLFQSGIWADHPDYRFACHSEEEPNLEPCIVDGIGQDSSHSFRHPLWFRSLIGAASRGPTGDEEFYQELQGGFTTQFVRHVLVPPDETFPTYRTTNYMDGRNGLYRWEYETVGENSGYGPYDLSGSLTVGWWSFFDHPQITRMYSQITSQFPLEEEVIDVYVGPNTSRSRNSMVSLPESYQNGLRKLLCSLSYKKSVKR